MKTIKHPLKLLVWLSCIVVFTTYSITPTFARTLAEPPNAERSHLHDRDVLTKMVLKHYPEEFLDGNVEQLKVIGFETLAHDGTFTEMKLSGETMKALKSAVTKAAKDCSAFEEEAFGGCLKNCLADVGVTPYSLIICGATCVTGVIVICALCLGITVTVLEVCTLGCATYIN